MRSFATLLLLGALASCSSTSPRDRQLEVGNWGGEGVGIFVEATRVTFMFDCAGGGVDGTIALAPDGTFDVTGTWVNGGNAFGVDHTPQPVRYVGQVTRHHVHFVLIMPPGGLPRGGAYDADYGVAPHAAAC